jgi:hypothetical protein
MRADDAAELAGLLPEVTEAPELGAELLTRYRTHRPLRGVVVTDLLDPRPAFWRSVAPVPPTEAEALRLREGRDVHEWLGRRLAPAAAREVRVRRDGIVGRIDILDDRPLELKSTANVPRVSEDPRDSRPAYIEQLAMYGALVDRHDGRLVILGAPATPPPETRVWDVALGDLSAIFREMGRRAAQLRRARETGRSDGLPRCGWFDRGCAFQREGVCDCSGAEPNLGEVVLDEVTKVTPNPEAAAAIAGLLREAPVAEPGVARFRELAYPRRAYFDGVDREAELEPEGLGRSGPPDETWSAVQAVLEDGALGEYELRHDPSGEPAEAIPTFRGAPVLVKSSRSLAPVPADRLLADRPHYLLELALRCASLGLPVGWLVLGMERIPSESEWIRVQQVRFGSLPGLAALLERRKAGLARARRDGDPSGLPVCPPWMAERCPHRAICGCSAGTTSGRT